MTDVITNQPPSDMDRLTLAVREALTDTMVERIAAASANAMALLDRFNDEATSEAVHSLIDRVTELHKLGALDTLFHIITLLHAARNATTDNIIERLFMFVESMVNTVGNEAMGELAENTRLSLEEAARDMAHATPPRGGMMATLSLLSKPETQKTLAFLLAFSERLQQRTKSG
jgi:uncharacterized protein YjgD (DUF1641 family)